MWGTEASWHAVGVEGVEVAVRIGAFPRERLRPQRVAVSVTLYRRGPAYAGGGLAACLDYDRLYRFLQDVLPARPHVDLLEELAETLVAFALEDERAEACRIRLAKLDVYNGRGMPVVEVVRRRETAP